MPGSLQPQQFLDTYKSTKAASIKQITDSPPSVASTMTARGFDPNSGTHGTKFTPGMESVQPANKIGGRMIHGDLSDPNRTYFTANKANGKPSASSLDNSDKRGWNWANIAANNNLDVRSTTPGNNYARSVPGRPVVHQVEPQGKIGGDRNLNPGGKVGAELTADSLKITDTDWIEPPGYKSAGNQGTLPQENWNRFGEDTGEDRNSISVEQQQRDKTPQRTQMNLGPSEPSTNEQQFKKWKARKNVAGQAEMFDRPATWDKPGQKAG